MESTVSTTTTTLFTISKTLTSNSNQLVSPHRQFFTTRPSQCLHRRLAFLRLGRILNCGVHRSAKFSSFSSSSLWSLSAAVVPSLPVRSKLERVSGFAASFASGSSGGIGGSDIGDGGSAGGGGGDGAADGGEAKANAVAAGFDDVSAPSSDVIILDVGGMSCGGCAASVKRILESQPQVSSASVNLTTETAVVWPVSEAKVVQNWQKILGDALAKHLTGCGFKSNLRGQGATDGDIPS